MFNSPIKMKSELISVKLSFNHATLPHMVKDKITWPDEFKEILSMSKSNMSTQSIQTVENEYEFEYSRPKSYDQWIEI